MAVVAERSLRRLHRAGPDIVEVAQQWQSAARVVQAAEKISSLFGGNSACSCQGSGYAEQLMRHQAWAFGRSGRSAYSMVPLSG